MMIFVRNKSEVPKLMAGLPLFRKIKKSLNTQPLPLTNSILSEQIASAFSTPAIAPNATLPPLIALAFLGNYTTFSHKVVLFFKYQCLDFFGVLGAWQAMPGITPGSALQSHFFLVVLEWPNVLLWIQVL